jgi:hypothetical protein
MILDTQVADERDDQMRSVPTREKQFPTVVKKQFPDPDVERLRIRVEVRAPAHDITGPGGTLDGNYHVLYETERAFPVLPPGPTPADPGLTIDIAYVDAPSILDCMPYLVSITRANLCSTYGGWMS